VVTLTLWGFFVKDRLSQEFVVAAFESEGYTVVSEYKNSVTPIDCICPEGKEYKIYWGNWRKGYRCKSCVDRSREQNTLALIKESFESEGYKLLSDSFYSRMPVKFECPQGHQHKIRWDTWRDQGSRCGVCARRHIDTDYVKEAFKIADYTLLSEYVDNVSFLNFACPQGHKHQVRWSQWQGGYQCPYCSGKPMYTIEHVRDSFALEGYKLLSDTYKNGAKHLKFECPKGHIHKISRNSWQRGKRCGLCFQETVGAKHIRSLRARSVISERINAQASKSRKTWRDFYDDSDLTELCAQVAPIYKKRTKGVSVDHIIPCSWFDLTKKEELIACWNLKNLRLLPWLDNIKRGNKISSKEFKGLLKTHSDILCKASRIPSKYKSI
jgi:hypothetical protein